MSAASRRFDEYLKNARTDELKQMARIWGARGPLKKDQCIATILQGLSDPGKIRAALADLQPFERQALALLKQMGEESETGMLAVALRASGVTLPGPNLDNEALIASMIRRGLLLNSYPFTPTYFFSSYGQHTVFSDERLLEQVGLPGYEPFDLKPASQGIPATFRSPQTVLLDVLGILQAIEKMGGLQLTQSGAIRVNETRKLAKAMGWREDALEVDGIMFPNPAVAFAGAFRACGLLTVDGRSLVLADSIDRFAARPYAEQVRMLIQGFIKTEEWQEWLAGSGYGVWDRYVRGRLGLIVSLAALPVGVEGMFSIEELNQAIFERIGGHFSLGYSPARPYYYFGLTPTKLREESMQWQEKIRAEWAGRERPWIERAISTWIYYLGLVELGMEGRNPASIRLTNLGLAVLHPDAPVSIGKPTGDGKEAWVVQPNFDMVVYLDRTTPEQLTFLERHAERVQAQRYTAQYRLTRESAYRGLEKGTSPGDLLSQLQAGAGVELPQNVVVEIREWGALREKITLRRLASLLEFPDGPARQKALQDGLKGTPVGDRMVLPETPASARKWAQETVDYAFPMPPCLSVNEDGIIKLTGPALDLLLEAHLDRWADRLPGGKWRLTPESVSRAVKGGAKVGDLFKVLKDRLTRSLPLLLGVALRAWAGEAAEIEMETVIVLRCPQPEVFQAIANSKKLRPYWRGVLAPDALLVDAEQVEALSEQLAWVGLKVQDELIIG